MGRVLLTREQVTKHSEARNLFLVLFTTSMSRCGQQAGVGEAGVSTVPLSTGASLVVCVALIQYMQRDPGADTDTGPGS